MNWVSRVVDLWRGLRNVAIAWTFENLYFLTHAIEKASEAGAKHNEVGTGRPAKQSKGRNGAFTLF